MFKLRQLVLLLALFSVTSAADLSFFPFWEKHKHTLQVVHSATDRVHGHVECWLVYDHDKGVKEGVISYIHVKRYAQGCGLGKYLFSRAIKFIDAHEIVKKTRWYAYPPGKESSDKSFKKLLENLVAFYKYLGGKKDCRMRDSGVYFYLDHTDRKLVTQRLRDAANPPVGYKLEEPKDEKQSIYAARVYVQSQAGKSKALCEVQYEKEGRAKVIKGVRLLDKRISKKVVTQIIDLIAEKLRVSRDAVECSLTENLSSGVRLPALYDDLFFEREETSEDNL